MSYVHLKQLYLLQVQKASRAMEHLLCCCWCKYVVSIIIHAHLKNRVEWHTDYYNILYGSLEGSMQMGDIGHVLDLRVHRDHFISCKGVRTNMIEQCQMMGLKNYKGSSQSSLHVTILKMTTEHSQGDVPAAECKVVRWIL